MRCHSCHCTPYGAAPSIFLLPMLLSGIRALASELEELEVPIEVGETYVSLIQMGLQPATQHLLSTDSEVWSSSEMRLASPIGLLHIPYNHVAVNISYHNRWEQAITFPERRPREFNVLLATFKTWMADFLVQMLDSRGSWKVFDVRRSLAFAVFGFLYIGLMQWFLYITILTWIFPDAMIFANAPIAIKVKDYTGQLDMVGQVILDNLLFNALIYFPAFYLLKQLIQGAPGTTVQSRMMAGLTKYASSWKNDNWASCMIWIPADLFIFACSMYLRMPLEHCVSLGWTMYMSFTRGAVSTPPKFESGQIKAEA